MPIEPCPFNTVLIVASRSIAYLSAMRTSILSKGATSICIGMLTCVPVGISSTLMSGVCISMSTVLKSHSIIASTASLINAVCRALTSVTARNSTESKCARTGFPVIGEFLEHRLDAGLEGFDRIAAGAALARPIDLSLLVGGQHHQMIVGKHIGKVGAARRELDRQCVGIVDLDLFDRGEECGRTDLESAARW